MNFSSSGEWPPARVAAAQSDARASAPRRTARSRTQTARRCAERPRAPAPSAAPARSAFSMARFFGTTSPITTCTKLMIRNATANAPPCSQEVGARRDRWMEERQQNLVNRILARPSEAEAGERHAHLRRAQQAAGIGEQAQRGARRHTARAPRVASAATGARRRSATSAAAKKPFSATMATSRISRRDMRVRYNRAVLFTTPTAPGDQSEHSGFAGRASDRDLLVRVAPAAETSGEITAPISAKATIARDALGRSAHPGGDVGRRGFSAGVRHGAGSHVADGRAAAAGRRRTGGSSGAAGARIG